MSNINKILKKMKDNPLNNWVINDLETVARHFEISIRKSGGSHVIFQHNKWVEALSVPARRPIKPVYIKRFLSLIEILECKNE